MADYNKDMQDRAREKERQELKITSNVGMGRKDSHTDPNKDIENWVAVNVEIKNGVFMKIAHEAHSRDITINKMVNIILKHGIKDAQYRFEHQSKPQFLTEKY